MLFISDCLSIGIFSRICGFHCRRRRADLPFRRSFAGLPAHVAIGTNKLSSTFGYIGLHGALFLNRVCARQNGGVVFFCGGSVRFADRSSVCHC